jgi:hypothetical protein
MPPKIDETGNRYGRLVVISEARTQRRGHIRWRCKCDCGNYSVVQGTDLRRGKSQSCGCYRTELMKNRLLPKSSLKRMAEARLINMRGRRYGSLLVLNKPPYSIKKRMYWRCKCDCGKRKTIYGYLLRSGKVKSCGCQRLRDKSRRTRKKSRAQ